MINRNANRDRDRSRSNDKELKINYRIKAREVRVIFENGIQEVLSIEDAIKKAKEAGLDLVEVSPNVSPRFVRLLIMGNINSIKKSVKKSKKRIKK